MDVSIIIINYNTFELTCQCIKSVLAETSNLEIEIVLVDNASVDRDPSEFINIFPDLILVKNPENVGFARGNNIGIVKAKGDFILLLNSDTLLRNNAISITRYFLATHPQVAVATGRLQYPNGIIQHNCQRFPSIRASLFELFRLQKIVPGIGSRVLFGPFFKYDRLVYPDWVWGTFFMFKRDLLNVLPGNRLPDDYFMYGEDIQWCMEFRKRGYKVAFLHEPHIEHLLGASGAAKQELMQQNNQHFLEMYYPFWKRIFLSWLNKLLKKT